MPKEHFGIWLKAQLRRREMTGSDLARKIDRPASMINRWVAGNRIPNPESCDLIADALAIDLDTVLAVAGHRPATEHIAPDDPRAMLIDMVRRVKWDSERVELVEGNLRVMLKQDASRRASGSSSS